MKESSHQARHPTERCPVEHEGQKSGQSGAKPLLMIARNWVVLHDHDADDEHDNHTMRAAAQESLRLQDGLSMRHLSLIWPMRTVHGLNEWLLYQASQKRIAT